MTWTTVPGGGYHAEQGDRSYLVQRDGSQWTLTIYRHIPTLDNVSHRELTETVRSMREGKSRARQYARVTT